ncbi:MAG TPA: hypothetical protein VFU45_00790 [Gemmatimonadales bacterium]|nr:hypothetical protein [Gemmatimonadales bacterium]
MPRPTLADLVAALPNFLLAGTAILTWYDPTVLGVAKVSYFVALMLLEFIVLHSAAFMGTVAYGKEPKVGRVAGILGLALFYSLFAGGVALAFHRMWPLWAFWALVLNRLAGVLMGQGGDDGAAAVVRAGWAAGMMFYLVATLATLFLPLPHLGITAEVVAAQHFTASGLWVEQPWRVLAMAAVYYMLQGVSTLKAHGWAQRKSTNTPLSTNVERG